MPHAYALVSKLSLVNEWHYKSEPEKENVDISWTHNEEYGFGKFKTLQDKSKTKETEVGNG